MSVSVNLTSTGMPFASNLSAGQLAAADSDKRSLQVVHKEQYDDKRQVLQEATTVDDMYDMLAVYEQKVVTADQVSASI